jgi:cyanophycin synthetase
MWFARKARGLFRRIRGRPRVVSVTEAHNELFTIAARNIGLQVRDLGSGMLTISDRRSSLFVSNTNFSFESLTAYLMCGDKRLTSTILEENGLSVPRFRYVRGRNVVAALAAFDAFAGPVVVKPNHGACGAGVSVNVRSRRDFVSAYLRATYHCSDVIVEEFIAGNHWRITVMNGDLITAWQRLPAHVVGDGKHSIGQLIRIYNSGIRYRDGFSTAKPIIIDGSARRDLAVQGYALRSVLKKDEHAIVHLPCNSALGGRTLDVTGRIHDGFVEVAAHAAALLGAKLAGVDVIAGDITKPPCRGEFHINEVNTTPDLLSMNYTVTGEASAVRYAEKILHFAFGPAVGSQGGRTRAGGQTAAN